jgi:uncharacterized protein YggU (UPF0235/DUF167 family)
MEPWRAIAGGVQVVLRVTPRGGRDAIDGVETLSDGRSVLKLRVRAVADGGEANRAVTGLLAKSLGVPKAAIRLTSGAASRLKQVAISGDPAVLGAALRKLTSATTD